MTSDPAVCPRCGAQDECKADLLAVLKQALEEIEDGLHHTPCDEPSCWIEAAERAIAKAQWER